MHTSGRRGPGFYRTRYDLQPRVDRFRLERQHGEHAFVYAPERLAAGQPVDGFQPEGVLAQCQRALVAEAASTQSAEIVRLGVVRPVDDPEVLAAAHFEAGLHESPAATGQVRGGLDYRALPAAVRQVLPPRRR